MKPSAQLILRALRRAGKRGASKVDLWRETSVWNAGARVHELRTLGYDIRTRYVTCYGVVYGRYVLERSK